MSELLYKEAFTHARLPLADHRLDGGHPGLHHRRLRRSIAPTTRPTTRRVVVVGDVREGELLRQDRRQPTARSRPPRSRSRTCAPSRRRPPSDASRSKSPRPREKIAIGYHGPAFGDVDHAPLTMLSTRCCSAGRSSRVLPRHRARSRDRHRVRGWVGTFRDPGLYEIYATARPGKTSAELIAALDASSSGW